MEIPYDVKRRGPKAIDHYCTMICNGVSESLAEMFACRQFPGINGTDTAWIQGRQNNQMLDTETPAVRDLMLQSAKEAGVSISGKVYVSQLADHACDPNAWVASKEEAAEKAKAKGRKIGKLEQLNGGT